MRNILTTNDQLVHKVTIKYGHGLSVDPAQKNVSHDWATIERQLNIVNRPSSVVIDYWENEVTKEHPLVPEQLKASFRIRSEHDDRLHSITIRPIPGLSWFDNYVNPQALRLLTSHFELYLIRGDEKWRPSIAAKLVVYLQTGQISIL